MGYGNSPQNINPASGNFLPGIFGTVRAQHSLHEFYEKQGLTQYEDTTMGTLTQINNGQQAISNGMAADSHI